MTATVEQQQPTTVPVLGTDFPIYGPHPADPEPDTSSDLFGMSPRDRVTFYDGILEGLELAEDLIRNGGVGCEAREFQEGTLRDLASEAAELRELRAIAQEKAGERPFTAVVAQIEGAPRVLHLLHRG